MKKRFIALLVGAFIVTTVGLASGREKAIYEKKEHFTSSDQIIEKINNKELRSDRVMDISLSDDFSECLSKRCRVVGVIDYFYKLDIKGVVEIEDKEKEAIIENYETNRKIAKINTPYSNCQVIRIDAECFDGRYGEYYAEEDISFLTYFDIVLIDEGEGLVIDYMIMNNDASLTRENVGEEA